MLRKNDNVEEDDGENDDYNQPVYGLCYEITELQELKKQLICLNVGGVRFKVMQCTLQRLPDTILGNINVPGQEWVKEEFYDNINKEYFFDRNPVIFGYILNFFRTGELHIPQDKCGASIRKEFDFWGINDGDISACCWLSYSQVKKNRILLEDLENELKAKLSHMNKALPCDLSKIMESDTMDNANVQMLWKKCYEEQQKRNVMASQKLSCYKKFQRFRQETYEIMNDHQKSLVSMIYAVFLMIVTLTSIVVYVFETHKITMTGYLKNETTSELTIFEDPLQDLIGCLNNSQCEIRRNRKLFEFDFWIQIFFSFDIFVRLCVCPSIKVFFRNFFNWNDLLSIVPFYVNIGVIILNGHTNLADIITQTTILSHSKTSLTGILRILQVTRILKLMKHFSGTKVLFYTFKSSVSEILLIIVFIALLTLLFGATMFFTESTHQYKNIGDAFWWAVVTATTVGFGDFVPTTVIGYIIGGICAISGMLVVAFTVPVGVSNFTLFYGHAQSRLQHGKRMKKQKDRMKKLVQLNTMNRLAYSKH
ncbi:hypothetical protein SNEBB_006735 [Seison nebaliae]|nr:hypothetical protein SNEBB_006735 [Seison nebaliae]